MNKFLLFFYFFVFLILSFKFDYLVDDLVKLKSANGYGIVDDIIINDNKYSDGIVTINGAIAVKRDVYTYQWREIQKMSNKIGTYKYDKIWSKNIIDSTKFSDKTKNNNVGRNLYKSSYFILDNIKTRNYKIDKKYYEKYIELEPFNFKTDAVFYGQKIKNKDYFVNSKESYYTDLDIYISDNDKKVAQYDRDVFRVVGNGVLFSGKNYNNPEIGDIVIVYKVFKANKIYFFGEINGTDLTAYKNYFVIDFKDNIHNDVHLFKMKFLFIFIISVNVLMLLIKLILGKLKQLKSFTLRRIPFFNEYFSYSNKDYFNIFCLFSITMLILTSLYIFIIIPAILLFIARQIDYYSI